MNATTKAPTINPVAERYAGSVCKLDGKPAKIVGRFNPFATVYATSGNQQGFEFSWAAVKYVMERDGNFHS